MSPTFAEALKKARLGKGWTQAQLAEKVGICACTLYKYEKGDYEPSLINIVSLADALSGWFLPFWRKSVPNHYFRL